MLKLLMLESNRPDDSTEPGGGGGGPHEPHLPLAPFGRGYTYITFTFASGKQSRNGGITTHTHTRVSNLEKVAWEIYV